MNMLSIGLFGAAVLTVACAPVSVGDPAPPSPVDGATLCKAERYQRYIGRNRSDLPARPAGEVWRVTCTTCPVTMDYNPHRLNILFEESNGVIRDVKCG
ncbi:MAG: I78 family peptidase inhibitor [Rhodoferax sp.]|uniref:I78 family peptidase inhibitor n=1 Tax=Rhodoferax sp. TaxID=50421 RepID=UPI0027309ABE|nr:I78 family peptidase inhibitor [Rhodoferax sp.]MDP1528404.1 I78 family peptidase inhibitor [Rhodoferax sp.]